MAKFVYKAKKSPQEIVDGTVEAESLDGALDKITQLGYVPIDITAEIFPKRAPREPKKTLVAIPAFSSRISTLHISLFTRQLADLIGSGIPVLRALNVIANQTTHIRFKEVVQQVAKHIQDGGTLSEALARHPQIFSNFFINMVKSGEVGGNLENILNRIADFTEKDQEIRMKVRSSLVYPLLICGVGFLTIFVLMTFVIPRLVVLFEDLSETLPLPTLILLSASSFLQNFWWLIVALITGGIIYLRQLRKTPQGKLAWDSFVLRVPFLGKFIVDAEIARFARTLATLIDCGVVIVAALNSVWAIMENEVIKNQVKKTSEDIAGGSSLTSSLKMSPLFPEVVLNMVAVGEESGRLEQSLYKLAETYERQVDRVIKIFTTILEPVMIIVVGGIVGFIVLAMLLPIFQMNLMIK